MKTRVEIRLDEATMKRFEAKRPKSATNGAYALELLLLGLNEAERKQMVPPKKA